MKPTLLLSLPLAAVLSLACNGAASKQPGQSVSESMAAKNRPPRTEQPETADAGATTDAPAKPKVTPIAIVNGEPIDQAAFVRLVIDARGLPILQQILVREVARQEAARLKINVTQDDIDREYDVALKGERFNGKDVEALTPARREQLVNDWTRSRGVSREELAIAMERQSILRKIAGNQISETEITEEMIEREYQREHGEKVEVRHIQFANQRVYSQIRQRLDAGDRFEDLVADYSQNALTKIQQGRMPAFTRDDDTVPQIMVKAAFMLEPGDVSNPIEVDGYFHVLKLDRKIPADNVPLEDIREKLTRGFRSRLIESRMEIIGRRLLMAAALQIQDPTLAEKYRVDQKTGRIEGPPLLGQ